MLKKDRIDIEKVLIRLKEKRKVFASEADFQLEFAWCIKELYPNYRVRLEYSPVFNNQIHIDILVITDEGWVPIELKYKTRKSYFECDGDIYSLKDQSAKDQGCYDYIKDIERIEGIRKNIRENFMEGYAIMLTNDSSYRGESKKKDCYYREFSINEDIIKKGTMSWDEKASKGTKSGREMPIRLEGEYCMHWEVYSKLNNDPSGTFYYLISKIINDNTEE